MLGGKLTKSPSAVMTHRGAAVGQVHIKATQQPISITW